MEGMNYPSFRVSIIPDGILETKELAMGGEEIEKRGLRRGLGYSEEPSTPSIWGISGGRKRFGRPSDSSR